VRVRGMGLEMLDDDVLGSGDWEGGPAPGGWPSG